MRKGVQIHLTTKCCTMSRGCSGGWLSSCPAGYTSGNGIDRMTALLLHCLHLCLVQSGGILQRG